MSIRVFNFTYLIFFFFLCSSCSLFEGEKEVKIPGKREDVFTVKEKKLVKSFTKVSLPNPILIKDWPQISQNSSNRLFHFMSNDKLKKKWETKIGKGEGKIGPYIVSPIVLNELIYTIDNNSKLQARSSISGKLKWSKELEEESNEKINFIGGLAAEGDFLLVTSGLGNLYAFKNISGELIWKKNLLTQISAPPLIENKKVFVTTDDNQLIVLDLLNGDNIWSHSGNLESVSIIGGVSPAIENEFVFVTYSSGEIFALNENNGSVLWYENLSNSSLFSDGLITDIQSPPVISGDYLYVVNSSGQFVSFQAIDGERVWELDVSTINPITISGNYIFLIDTSNKLYCVTKDSGNIVWVVQLKTNKKEEILWVGPLLTSHKLIVASSEGTILSLSPYTGETLSLIKENGSFTIQPIQAGKYIYFVSKEGKLITFE